MKTPFGKAAAGHRSRTSAGHASVSVAVMKRKAAQKKHRSRPTSQPQRNIVGCRIRHGWKDGDEPLTQWKGTVLDQSLLGQKQNCSPVLHKGEQDIPIILLAFSKGKSQALFVLGFGSVT